MSPPARAPVAVTTDDDEDLSTVLHWDIPTSPPTYDGADTGPDEVIPVMTLTGQVPPASPTAPPAIVLEAVTLPETELFVIVFPA